MRTCGWKADRTSPWTRARSIGMGIKWRLRSLLNVCSRACSAALGPAVFDTPVDENGVGVRKCGSRKRRESEDWRLARAEGLDRSEERVRYWMSSPGKTSSGHGEGEGVEGARMLQSRRWKNGDRNGRRPPEATRAPAGSEGCGKLSFPWEKVHEAICAKEMGERMNSGSCHPARVRKWWRREECQMWRSRRRLLAKRRFGDSGRHAGERRESFPHL